MMMTKNKMVGFTLILFALFSIAFIGCSSGGSDSPQAAAPTPTPSLEVLPASFDFGTLTDGNTVQPLEVTIRNGGTANLSVSDIALSDILNFALNLGGGTNPCASAAPTIGAGSSCTVTVDFTPPIPPAPGSSTDFSANLTIRSDDPTTPVFDVSLMGTLEDISEINVKINQIVACPRSGSGGLATVYVSVTDQGGFPVTGLTGTDFSLSENGGLPIDPTTDDFVNNSVTISVALLLDYSRSITTEPVNVTDMENAAIGFVEQLGINDEAEIIVYADSPVVTQSFTSDQAALIAAIQSPPNVGTHTALFDALAQAVTDISSSTKTRRAIIIITDGKDDDGTGGSQSTSSLTDVITDANGNAVPVFTVGLGNADVAILTQLADDTGGTFSDATTSANLATIYDQLADLLFTNQYILTYNSAVPSTSTGNLTVSATYTPPDPDILGSDTKISGIPACP